MDITKVNFTVRDEQRGPVKILAYADVVFDDCFVIHGIKLVEGEKGIHIAMPSKKVKSGGFTDIAHPIKKSCREKFTKIILDEYKKEISK